MILYRTQALPMVTKSPTRVVAAAYFNIAILRGTLGDTEKEGSGGCGALFFAGSLNKHTRVIYVLYASARERNVVCYVIRCTGCFVKTQQTGRKGKFQIVSAFRNVKQNKPNVRPSADGVRLCDYLVSVRSKHVEEPRWPIVCGSGLT